MSKDLQRGRRDNNNNKKKKKKEKIGRRKKKLNKTNQRTHTIQDLKLHFTREECLVGKADVTVLTSLS